MSARRFKLATRNSPLARIQAEEAVNAFQRRLPETDFVPVFRSSPGDRDKHTDLRDSVPDFFTRDLHAAVLDGTADGAVHSAKDLEAPLPGELDGFWLPDPADPEDALVLRHGEDPKDLKPNAVAGVSSRRREAYCRRTFPHWRIRGIRGNIGQRLARLDAGEYDVLIMAVAGLQRLGLGDRVSRRIPREELPPPEGQGSLAVTFRAGDARFMRLRSLFVRTVVFAGAGCGAPENCTLGVLEALERCDVCVHDRLLDSRLLDRLPPRARRVDAGKRGGCRSVPQDRIHEWIATAACRGRRVVRLQGGDPGLFGRLAEEIAALDARRLPYRVLPGVSSLNAATTGTGLLLTRRNVSPGFTVMTPRRQGGGVASVRAAARSGLPLVFFMGVRVLDEISRELVADGWPSSTPVAVVFDAGTADVEVIRGTLADISAKVSAGGRPGIVIAGVPDSDGFHPEWGALMGRRVLLPGTETLLEKSVDAVRDLGGTPLPFPRVRTVPNPACRETLKTARTFDWLAVTSPSAVHCLMRMLPGAGLDARDLPKIMVSGPGTAEAFRAWGIVPDAIPRRNFGIEGLCETVTREVPAGASILRLRSDAAGDGLAREWIRRGFTVRDAVLYRNEPGPLMAAPDFDAVIFASASAVAAFMDRLPAGALAGKPVVALGRPTREALERHGIPGGRLPAEATIEAAVESLAAGMVQRELEKTS